MTTQLAPPIVFQSILSNGSPNAFGTVATYIAGTTTPQATWVDSTQTTQNPNPTPLNALGQASIWLATNLVYKFVVFDSLGNQINFQDQIAGGVFAVPLGASLIPTPTNTLTLGNATNSWAQLYLGPNSATAFDTTTGIIGFYPRTTFEISAGVTPISFSYPELNVLRYGADPSGAADSGPAANTAISVMVKKVASIGIAGAMIWPAGVYKIATQIAITNDTLTGFAMIGAGEAVTRLNNNVVSASGVPAEPMIKLTCRNAYFTFQGFLVSGTNQNNASGNGNGHAFALINPDPVGTAGVSTFYPQTVMFRDIATRFHIGIGKDFSGATTSNTITGITQASQAVITVSTVSGSNPFAVGQGMIISGVGGMTQMNGQYPVASSVGGSSGAWTATTNINSTAFTAYTSGGTAAAGIPSCSLYNYASTVHDMDHCSIYNDLMGVRVYLSEKTHINDSTIDGNNGVGITGLYLDSVQDTRFSLGTLNGWGLGTSNIDSHVYMDATSQPCNGVSVETSRVKGTISASLVTPLFRADGPQAVVNNFTVRDCDLRQLNDTGSHATSFFILGNGVRNAHIIDNFFLVVNTFTAAVGVDCVQAISGFEFAGLKVEGNTFTGGGTAIAHSKYTATIRVNISTNSARCPIIRGNVFGDGANYCDMTDCIRLDGNHDAAYIGYNEFNPFTSSTFTNCINFPSANGHYPTVDPNFFDFFSGTITNNVVGFSNNLLPRQTALGLTSDSTTPTIASAATIAPTAPVTFISGVTQINTITAPASFQQGGGQFILIPTGLWSTGVTGNIALATTAVVSKLLIMRYDAVTNKFYPSY